MSGSLLRRDTSPQCQRISVMTFTTTIIMFTIIIIIIHSFCLREVTQLSVTGSVSGSLCVWLNAWSKHRSKLIGLTGHLKSSVTGLTRPNRLFRRPGAHRARGPISRLACRDSRRGPDSHMYGADTAPVYGVGTPAHLDTAGRPREGTYTIIIIIII